MTKQQTPAKVTMTNEDRNIFTHLFRKPGNANPCIMYAWARYVASLNS